MVVCLPIASRADAEQMPWIKVADDNSQFVLAGSEERFVAWGFNYDHDEEGRLLEDYWNEKWPKVVEDFKEMKSLGANVVRVHLQLGKFMRSADEPDPAALEQLSRLLELAEEQRLYLDLTGLGCYHKADIPAWYDDMSEAERWRVQAAFWEAVAETCADSPAIFCYDLMNEPVVPGRRRKQGEWLGPGFGGKHFVQMISLDPRGRERPEIARSWIRQLSAAIRKHDQRHLITVGLVQWSLDRPGLTSGFVPSEIASELDFLCVHLYPESGEVDEALETLKAFAAVGKPLVIEETFPLKCSAAELGQFLEEARDITDGVIGFYWGKTPQQIRESGTLKDVLMLAWLELFQKYAPTAQPAAAD